MKTENPNADDPAIDLLAGEYVLGTLPADQRAAVQRRLPREPALRAAVDAWERRLHPLIDRAPAQTPSPGLWPRIERSLASRVLHTDPPMVVSPPWWERLALWRGLTAAGLAASLVLGTLLLTREAPSAAPGYLVVLVAPQDRAPGWVIQAGSRETIQLIPLGTYEVPSDKTLQFWTKGDDWQGPVSLGLVRAGQVLDVSLDRLPPLQPNQLFELTLEPRGGSVTGKPSGPIQFIGRAVKVL